MNYDGRNLKDGIYIMITEISHKMIIMIIEILKAVLLNPLSLMVILHWTYCNQYADKVEPIVMSI